MISVLRRGLPTGSSEAFKLAVCVPMLAQLLGLCSVTVLRDGYQGYSIPCMSMGACLEVFHASTYVYGMHCRECMVCIVENTTVAPASDSQFWSGIATRRPRGITDRNRWPSLRPRLGKAVLSFDRCVPPAGDEADTIGLRCRVLRLTKSFPMPSTMSQAHVLLGLSSMMIGRLHAQPICRAGRYAHRWYHCECTLPYHCTHD